MANQERERVKIEADAARQRAIITADGESQQIKMRLTAQAEGEAQKIRQMMLAQAEGFKSQVEAMKAADERFLAVQLINTLPEVFQNVRKRFPNLKISLREGYPQDFENLLLKEELDLAVTAVEKKPAAGLRSAALAELPLVLLVPKSSRVTAAEQLWQRDKIEEPLICLPAAEAICKNFQQGLARLGEDWFPSIEVSSLDLIETYVANGFGIGLSVRVPQAKLAPNARVVPLPDFAPVVLGVMWRGKTSALSQAFLDEMRLRAKRFSPLTASDT